MTSRSLTLLVFAADRSVSPETVGRKCVIATSARLPVRVEVGVAGAAAATEPIDLTKPMYVSLEGRWTKKTGYATLENGKMERAP